MELSTWKDVMDPSAVLPGDSEVLTSSQVGSFLIRPKKRKLVSGNMVKKVEVKKDRRGSQQPVSL